VTKGFYIGKIVPSDVDGPGTRAVIHFAGCSIGCPGCFNPHTHSGSAPGVWSGDAHSIAREMVAMSPHVTISGGEPTDQDQALYELLIALRLEGAESVVMFTGRRVEWIRARRDNWSAIESEGLIDTVIDGPYIAKLDETDAVMRGSSNQRIIHYTTRFSDSDFQNRDIEINIGAEGFVMTGFPDHDLIEALTLMAG
jgi:anaerobic ribonucleoside-triphosphate reductase activating protein